MCSHCLKVLWSKKLVRKWFNIKGKTEEFHADEVVYGGKLLTLILNFCLVITIILLFRNFLFSLINLNI